MDRPRKRSPCKSCVHVSFLTVGRARAMCVYVSGCFYMYPHASMNDLAICSLGTRPHVSASGSDPGADNDDNTNAAATPKEKGALVDTHSQKVSVLSSSLPKPSSANHTNHQAQNAASAETKAGQKITKSKPSRVPSSAVPRERCFCCWYSAVCVVCLSINRDPRMCLMMYFRKHPFIRCRRAK